MRKSVIRTLQLPFFFLLMILFLLFFSFSITFASEEIEVTDFSTSAPNGAWQIKARKGYSSDGRTYTLKNVVLKVRGVISPDIELVAISSQGILKGDVLTLMGPLDISLFQNLSENKKFVKMKGKVGELKFFLREKKIVGKRFFLKEYNFRGEVKKLFYGKRFYIYESQMGFINGSSISL